MIHRIKVDTLAELMQRDSGPDRLVAEYIRLKQWYESIKEFNNRVEAGKYLERPVITLDTKIPYELSQELQSNIGHLLHTIEVAAVIEVIDLEDAINYYIQKALKAEREYHGFTACECKTAEEIERGKMYFDERHGVPSGMSFADAVADEVEIKPYPIGIIWQGAIYYPCKSREGVLFIDKKYLAPFEEGAVLYERWAENGTPYIVSKRGMLLEGVITPAGIATAELAELLCEVGNLTEAVSEDGNGDYDAEAEQEEMDV